MDETSHHLCHEGTTFCVRKTTSSLVMFTSKYCEIFHILNHFPKTFAQNKRVFFTCFLFAFIYIVLLVTKSKVD
jgi:hypothetical protein